jgi:DNA-binding response OmpR family regulator
MTGPGKRVLVVDDDEQIVEAVQCALEERGYEVLTAGDGAEGLVRAERDEPDLILLDVVLPKRSGFSVLDHLRRSKFRSKPIIMLTANDEPRHRDFAASCGADAFIAKPFDLGELMARVDALLEQ